MMASMRMAYFAESERAGHGHIFGEGHLQLPMG